MIPLLPKWVLTNKLPAFYDMESGTAIEQTAKLYGAMQGLVDDYNKFVDDFNKTFEEYVNGLNKDHECFQASITKLVHDYIAMLDEKLKMQDKEIENTVKYIKENISSSIIEITSQMKESGELTESILNALDSMEPRMTEVETKATSNETRITEVETKATSNETRITEVETRITEVVTKANSNETKILEMGNSILENQNITELATGYFYETDTFITLNDDVTNYRFLVIRSGWSDATSGFMDTVICMEYYEPIVYNFSVLSNDNSGSLFTIGCNFIDSKTLHINRCGHPIVDESKALGIRQIFGVK